MEQPKPTPFWQDKNFIAILLVPVGAIVAKKFGIALDVMEIAAFAATVISFVVSAKWAGAAKAKAAAAGEAKAMEIKSASEALQALAAATGGTVEVYKPTGNKDVQ